MAIKICNNTIIPNLTGCNTTSGNTALGVNAICNLNTGVNNTALGAGAGCAITTGANNTVIGNLSGTAGLSNTLLLGAGTNERIRVDANCLVVNNGTGDVCARCYFGCSAEEPVELTCKYENMYWSFTHSFLEQINNFLEEMCENTKP